MNFLVDYFYNYLTWGVAVGVAGLTGFVVALQVHQMRKARAKMPAYYEIPDTVLHHMTSSSRLAPLSGKVDICIIGSGIGALTAASILSRLYAVLVVEQHTTIGGSTHTYKEAGYEFDVGVHYVGSELDRWFSPVRLLYDFLSDGKLNWNRITEQYDVAYNAATGERLEFTGDPKLKRKTILAHFPHVTRKALDRYYSRCFWARQCASFAFCLKLFPPVFTRLFWPLLEPVYRRTCLATTLAVMQECGLPDDVIGALTYS
jgi:all-trans-retinol 13,14-reductase